MATVITNLLSAIPVFGQDIVELMYIKINSYYITDINTITVNALYLSLLPTIGIVSKQSLKKGKKIRLDKKKYLSIPYQFICFMVGLIDGDGYIQVIKTTKGYISGLRRN